FDGGVSELRIWNGTRTATQIRTERYKVLRGDEKNLKGYWRSEARQGNILPDLSLQGNYGTIIRENQIPSKAKLLSLDGKTNSIAIPPFQQSFEKGISFEVWAYYEKITNWARIIDFGNGPEQDNIIIANAGRTDRLGIWIRGGASGNILHAFEHKAIELKKWIHFAFTLDPNGKVRMYKNGRLLASSIDGSEVHLPREVFRESNYIGKSNFGDVDGLFHGNLADLRIWDYPLSENDIMQRMHQQLTGLETGLVAYWPMNEGGGELINDRSASALHGKIFDPKKAVKNKIVQLLKQISALNAKKAAQTKRVHDLQILLDKKKKTSADIKVLEAKIKQVEIRIKANQKQITELGKAIQQLKKQRAKLASDASKSTAAVTALNASLAVLKVQRAQLAATNIFGIQTANIKKLDAQIKKISSDIRKHQTAIKRSNANRKSIDARIKKTNLEIRKLHDENRKLQLQINNDRANIAGKQRSLEALTKSIGNR
ncbi:MAG: LamG-like jellyroll fold domain-containing protein, partial [Bacteroidota bacterium]